MLRIKNYFPDYQNSAILLVIAFALFIRVIDLGDASLWLDEAHTISISSLPWNILWLSPIDPTPPLFYSIEKIILSIGDSEFLLRLPSTFFSTVAIFIIYRATYILIGFKGSIITALVLSLSTSNIEYAQEARLYVPVASLHLISRYSGSDTDTAPLHRLGSDHQRTQ